MIKPVYRSSKRYLAFWGVLLGCALSSSVLFAASSNGQEADDLLALKLLQAEQYSSLSQEIETTLITQSVTRTVQMKVWVDKDLGKARMQSILPETGRISTDVIVEGGKAWVHHPSGWRSTPLDEQTKGTLRAMGLEPDATVGTGLSGVEKPSQDERALSREERREVAKQAMAERRGEKAVARAARLQKHFDALQARIARRIAKLKKTNAFDRATDRDADGPPGSKALRSHPLPGADGKPQLPWTEEVEWVDGQTGLIMQKKQYLSPDAWPGGKDKIPADAKRSKSQAGSDQVEFGSTKVLSVDTSGPVPFVREAESRTQGLAARSRWNTVKVDSEIENELFKK